MKKSFLLALAYFYFPVDLRKASHVALDAISNIIRADFASFSGRVDFLSFGDNRDDESLVVKVISFIGDAVDADMSSVLLFDSLVQFKENEGKILWKTHNSKSYRHLAYVPDATTKDIEESVEDGWSIDNVAFLLNESEKSIDLATSFMFTKKTCRQNQLVTINRFTNKWTNEFFFPEKYANLHSCSLTFATAECPERSFGLNSRTLYELAKDLNFKIERICAKTMEQLFHHLNNDQLDFVDFLIGYVGTGWIHILISSERGVYIVPPGEPLTQLEKLLSPFDRETWVGVFTTLTVALVSIQVVSFTSRRIECWGFDQAVGSPTMNLLNVFLCGNQTKVPKTSTARFVFFELLDLEHDH